MELLIITAVRSFTEDIKQILKSSGVKVYSTLDVTGYKDLSDLTIDANWFGSDSGEHLSVLFYAFIEERYVTGVLKEIEALNETQETYSYVHAAVIDIKKHV
ncbi:MAG: hypothetical protein HRT61_00135 [Ekhidna sp.]|nr:hypothetical protein [Ekhidna sp.]